MVRQERPFFGKRTRAPVKAVRPSNTGATSGESGSDSEIPLVKTFARKPGMRMSPVSARDADASGAAAVSDAAEAKGSEHIDEAADA